MSESFVHLHCHSDLSALDGLGKVSEYVAEAKARNSTALAFTDHGNMRGFIQHHEHCQKAGLKPIFGTEIYCSPDMRRKGLTDEEKKDLTKDLPKAKHREAIKSYEEKIGLRDRWHLTVWAQTQEGLRNLYRLTSAAWLEGYYYQPRVDLAELIKHGDGLMVASGCLASPIHDQWRDGKKRAAMSFADSLYEAFGDRFWLEVQPHAIRDQRDANALMLKLRDRYKGSKLLATQDAHYVHQADAPHHDCLLCISVNANIDDKDRFRFDGDEFFFKTRKQMWQSFKSNHEFIPSQLVKEALDSTMEFAERCTATVEIDYKKALLPDPGIPEKYEGSAFSFLNDLCFDGWKWRQMGKRARFYAREHEMSLDDGLALYRNRVLYELKEIHRQRFERYFLIVRDIYREARERDILPGPGRGSVGGSLIAYLLGITSVDPIQHGLLFERFMNPDRKDLPDIDMDFEDFRREELIAYMREKYGTDYVSQISTVGRLKGKQVFRDVSRVLGVPLAEVNKVAPSIIDRPKHDEREFKSIEDSFAEFDVCKSFGKKYPDVYKYATKIEGTAKTLGIHAAGVVVSPVVLRDIVPLEARKSVGSIERTVVTAVDMEDVAKLGLVKLDFLGLKTLSVISRCLKKIEERHGTEIDLESQKFDIEDKKTLQAFTDHDYVGVFQYDSASSDQICKGVTFERFEDIATMTALNRPGASKSGMDEKFRERKANPALREKHDFHEKISELCGDTLGVFVYQEHAIKIFRAAGFSPGEADSLRKAIGKKLAKAEIDKYREQFVNGIVKNVGMPEDDANRLMDVLVTSAAYLFNKCLTGETLVERAGERPITIEELFSYQTAKTSVGEKFRAGRYKILQMDDDGRIRPGKVAAVYKNGLKKVFIVEAGNTSVRGTANHRLLTKRGYVRIDQLRIGEDELVLMGEKEPQYIKKGRQSDLAKGVSYEGRAGGLGVPDGEENPAWIDGRNVQFKNLVSTVRKRARGRCESCKKKWSDGLRFEVAHTHSLERCEGNFSVYHHPDNARYLCNSCHKRFDYQKGERKKAWSKGRPTKTALVRSVSYSGEMMTYDVEMATEGHNFIADGVVSHNSHATEYGLIAYWTQWLKVYYPLEFFWSWLVCEKETAKITDFAREAKRRDIDVLSPHINTSKKEFTIDDDAIRGSLVDIKGVGDGAAESIMEGAPYSDFVDFVLRINRRKCNRGAVAALAKAGAFGEMVCVRWLLGDGEALKPALDGLWKAAQAKKVNVEAMRETVKAGFLVPEFSDEETALMQAEVSPVSFGKHPLDAYKSFFKREVRVRTQSMEGDGYFEDWNDKGHFVLGMIKVVKKSQVGDFGDVDESDPDHGKPMAKVNIEDSSGTERRVQFHHYVYEQNAPALDAGVGRPLLVHCTAFAEWSSIRGHFAVDLAKMRQKLKTGEELTIWEEIARGNHPARLHPWKDEATKTDKIQNLRFYKRKDGGDFCGVVTHIQEKIDRKGGAMAYFGLLDAVGHYIRCIAFASVWGDVKHVIRPGAFVSVEVEKSDDRGGSGFFFGGGSVRVYKKTTL